MRRLSAWQPNGLIMEFLRKFDQNAERWLLLTFYVMLVITMAVEVLRREIFVADNRNILSSAIVGGAYLCFGEMRSLAQGINTHRLPEPIQTIQ